MDICVCAVLIYMYVPQVSMEEGIRSPGARITDFVSCLLGVLGTKL